MPDISSTLHRGQYRSLSPRERRPHASHRDRSDRTVVVSLPHGQLPLRKHDFSRYEALFAEYLDIQKGLNLNSIPSDEVKGRWKSFMNKWNRGELAAGWYDPEYFKRVVARKQDDINKPITVADESDDDLGPQPTSTTRGPAIPNTQDLQYKRELEEESRADRQSESYQERKLEKKAAQERINEIAPRAEAGTRERQLEKKREAAYANKSFADSKDSGAVEVADGDLLGEDGIDAYKARLKAKERVKNEREIRREENLRARQAEREERLVAHRAKEAKTMENLRALAQQRYG